MKKMITAALLAGALLITAGCGSGKSSAAGSGGGASGQEKVRISMVTHGIPNDPFWNVIRKGAQDAARDFDVDLDYQELQQGSANAGQEARLLQSVLATKPQGLAVTIPDASAMKGPIGQAVSSGLPTVAFNSGQSDYESLGLTTYVGFAESTTGETAAKAMLERGSKNAICVNHQQGNLLLERICSAFVKTVQAGGGTAKQLVVDGTNPTGTTADVKAALTQDPAIDGVYALGPQVHEAVKQGIQQAGKKTGFVFGQLNLTGILPDVVNGTTAFTIDLEPYLEGYLPVQFLAQHLRLGVMPQGLVSTGPLLVTADNAKQALDLSKENYR
jgi:simple sugar transport system substrate-binding protein